MCLVKILINSIIIFFLQNIFYYKSEKHCTLLIFQPVIRSNFQLYPDEGAGARLIKALGLKWTEPPIQSFHMIRSEPRLCRPNGIKDCSGDYTATSPTPSYTLYLTNRLTVDKMPYV